MKIKGINHVGISCTSIERSLAFYRDILGFDEIGLEWSSDASNRLAARLMALPNTCGRLLMLRAGNTYLELFEFVHPDPGVGTTSRPVSLCGFTHIAVEVSDIHAVHQRLTEAGIAFHTEPIDTGDGSLATYGHDPDGNVVELIEMPSGESRKYSLDALDLGLTGSEVPRTSRCSGGGDPP